MSSPSRTQKPLLIVVGATGNQGGSVVKTFLSESPEWQIRGLTRDPSSAASQALTAKGVEMVQADLNSPASLSGAFAGATAIFAVTDFWVPFGKMAAADEATQANALKPGQSINAWAYEQELAQAKATIDAVAKVEGLDRFVFSSLCHVKKWSKGKYTWVYHFDSKGVAVDYMEEQYPELWKKTSIIQIGVYLSNHIANSFFGLKKVAEGEFEFVSSFNPKLPLPYIAAEEDTGVFVRALVTQVPAGKDLQAYREMMSMDDFLRLWGKIYGVKATIKPLTFDEQVAVPLVGREIAETGAYIEDFGYSCERAGARIDHPKDLGIDFKFPSIEEWIKKQDWSGVLQQQ